MTDYIYDCALFDSSGINQQGVIVIEFWIGAEDTGGIVEADPIIIEIDLLGNFVISEIVSASVITIEIEFGDGASSGFIPETVGMATVMWSSIGALDFTVWKDNIAGERPLDWAGTVYDIRKLNGKVVVYGSGGVSFLIPMANAFSLDTFYKVGLKGKGAVTGDDKKHFFIDNLGQLWKIGENFNKLDYSEFLSSLASTLVMHYDALNDLVYICDSTQGFIFNPMINSLGKCEPGVTGIGLRGSTRYIVSTAVLTLPLFNICTDTYDMGNRKLKTIHSIEVGTDTTKDLYASVDYRQDYRTEFKQLDWFPVTQDGIAYLNCVGTESQYSQR